jgi:hypothetical protein
MTTSATGPRTVSRIRTIEKDPRGGWIARDPSNGQIILGDDFRWNSRESARCAVWEARNLPAQTRTT